MGNAGSMDQHTDFRGHNMPLKLPMPDPGELEERFATVLVRKNKLILNVCLFVPLHASVSWDGTWTAVCVCVCVCVCRLDLCLSSTPALCCSGGKRGISTKKVHRGLHLLHSFSNAPSPFSSFF